MKHHKNLFSKISILLLIISAFLYIWLSAFTPVCMQEIFENRYITYSDIGAINK